MYVFENTVLSNNLSVVYVRSILTEAGPLEDNEKRFKHINDQKEAQDVIVADFQKLLRAMTLSYSENHERVEVRVSGKLL